MIYLIDQRSAEPEMLVKLYRAALVWAAERGDRFLIHLQPSVYEDSSQLTRLLALGQVTQVTSDLPPGFVGRLTAKLFRGGSDVIQLEGSSGTAFTNELTQNGAPAKAISGDLSPVEDVMVLLGSRVLFASYDYGRDLLLDLNDEEVESLRRTLREAGLEAERVKPEPRWNAPDPDPG
jgi:hypothetical protein